jgi:hypothetical protein
VLHGLLTLALAALTSPGGASLDECIDRSDRIAAVLVRTVTPVRQSYPFLNGSEWPRAVIGVAELWIETSFVGPPDEHLVYALAQDARAPLALEPGQRYLLFLESDRTWTSASEGTRSALAGVTHGALLYQVLSCESVKLRVLDDEGNLADPQATDLWTLAELETRIEARLPFFVAHRVSTGPVPWMLRVAKDRSITGSITGTTLEPGVLDPAQPGRLSEASHRALWSALDSQRFLELPDEVGRPLGPCDGWLELEVRTRHGPRQVRIRPQDPASIEDAAQRDEMRRALAILDVLPATVER